MINERIRTYADEWLPIIVDSASYRVGLNCIQSIIDKTNSDVTPAYYIDVVIVSSEETALKEATEFLRGYYTDE